LDFAIFLTGLEMESIIEPADDREAHLPLLLSFCLRVACVMVVVAALESLASSLGELMNNSEMGEEDRENSSDEWSLGEGEEGGDVGTSFSSFGRNISKYKEVGGLQ